VPPDGAGATSDPVVDALGPVLAGLKDLEWAGYLSMTGVHGDREGGWVD